MTFHATAAIEHDARRFFSSRINQYLHPQRQVLINECTIRLMERYDLAAAEAERRAIGVLADIEGTSRRAHIDTDRTTRHALFFADSRGRRVVFTAADLDLLAQRYVPAQAEDAAAEAQACPAR